MRRGKIFELSQSNFFAIRILIFRIPAAAKKFLPLKHFKVDQIVFFLGKEIFWNELGTTSSKFDMTAVDAFLQHRKMNAL